jgi:hypothetical protein
LRNKLKNNIFSIQVDESTDFTSKGFVVAFLRFVNNDAIQENFFCCKELPETSKGQLTSCLHIREQKVCLGRTVYASVLMMHHQWLAPLVFASSFKKNKILTSQHTALFTET